MNRYKQWCVGRRKLFNKCDLLDVTNIVFVFLFIFLLVTTMPVTATHVNAAVYHVKINKF